MNRLGGRIRLNQMVPVLIFFSLFVVLSARAISFEDPTYTCPPCPAPLEDDGRFIIASIVWLALLLLLWPYKSLQKTHPKTYIGISVSIFSLSVIPVVVTSIIAYLDRVAFVLKNAIGGFITSATFAKTAFACLGCGDLKPVFYNSGAALVIILLFIGFFSLLHVRRVTKKASTVTLGENKPHEPLLKTALVVLFATQIVILAFYSLVLTITISTGG